MGRTREGEEFPATFISANQYGQQLSSCKHGKFSKSPDSPSTPSGRVCCSKPGSIRHSNEPAVACCDGIRWPPPSPGHIFHSGWTGKDPPGKMCYAPERPPIPEGPGAKSASGPATRRNDLAAAADEHSSQKGESGHSSGRLRHRGKAEIIDRQPVVVSCFVHFNPAKPEGVPRIPGQ